MLVQPNLKDASIMSSAIYSVITGTGSYIPSRRIINEDFLSNEFLEKGGSKIAKSNQEIIDKIINHFQLFAGVCFRIFRPGNSAIGNKRFSIT